MSVAQEPCVVLLPDGRLLVAMRTMAGAIWYSVSDDDGATWRKPEPLRYRDDGDPIPQPLAPAPIYPLADGRFLLVFHNNDGTRGGYSQWKTKWTVNQANYLRNPAFIAVGEFRPKAHQPIWFSAPEADPRHARRHHRPEEDRRDRHLSEPHRMARSARPLVSRPQVLPARQVPARCIARRHEGAVDEIESENRRDHLTEPQRLQRRTRRGTKRPCDAGSVTLHSVSGPVTLELQDGSP